ncbi:hypothetical protein [Pseudonocardia sp. ICBG1293]|uniref:hypothetical protein n=1 Tax=Pseudonocardia sp. ICBG1293 TaxID=2844382 RepID=UPI001CC93472|nr:hypothetical protein [Pseudonocardia sp. ICBG1293]
MTQRSTQQQAQYDRVLAHLQALHEPGFGGPSSIREPHVTRDGRRTVVTADVLDELDGVPRNALHTAEDGRFRQVSATGASARSGRFSPDGHTLAFLADRGERGVFQLHLLVDGRLGEAQAAPPVPGTVEYLHWSPDGRRILLGVAGLGADLSGGQGSGVNRRDADETPSWFPRIDDGAGEQARRSLWLYTPGTGALDRLSAAGLNCWEAGWCGPERVAAITSDGPGEDDWYRADLSLFEPVGSIRKVLGSDVQLALPTGSTDGRWLSVVEAVCSDRWVVAGDLLVVDRTSGAVRRIDVRGTDVSRAGVARRDPARLRRAAAPGLGRGRRRRRTRRDDGGVGDLLDGLGVRREHLPPGRRVHRRRHGVHDPGVLRAAAAARRVRLRR